MNKMKLLTLPLFIVYFSFCLSACVANSTNDNGDSGINMVGTYSYTITDSGCGAGVPESGTIVWSFNSTTGIYTVTMTSTTGLNTDDCTNTTSINASINFVDANPIEQGKVADQFFNLLTERGFPNPSSGSSQGTSENFSDDMLDDATYTREIEGGTTITLTVTA